MILAPEVGTHPKRSKSKSKSKQKLKLISKGRQNLIRISEACASAGVSSFESDLVDLPWQMQVRRAGDKNVRNQEIQPPRLSSATQFVSFFQQVVLSKIVLHREIVNSSETSGLHPGQGSWLSPVKKTSAVHHKASQNSKKYSIHRFSVGTKSMENVDYSSLPLKMHYSPSNTKYSSSAYCTNEGGHNGHGVSS